MGVTGWKYYNCAAIPTCAPHMEPDLSPIKDGSIWNIPGHPLLARWTTEFDCGIMTDWWYVIKDTPFDISALKAKRRYEINKGLKNFEVRPIVPGDYAADLYEVAIAAYETYPASYRPDVARETFIRETERWITYKSYGAFARETNELCGYVLLREEERYINFEVQKTIPAYERLGVNAALIYRILEDHTHFLVDGGYICDGSRSINHETAFQDYLEKYFGFRKAFCKLHIRYSKRIGAIVNLIYPFRGLLSRLGGSKMHKVSGLLKMEEIVRGQGKEK